MSTAPLGLIAPHGGTLIDRMLRGEELAAAKARAAQLPGLVLDADAALEAALIAAGGMSPLDGFMGPSEVHSVAQRMRLLNGQLWPIPIALFLHRQDFDRLKEAPDIALWTDEPRTLVGQLSRAEVGEIQVEPLAQAIFGTLDPSHPGVARSKDKGPFVIGGQIAFFDGERASDPRLKIQSPREVRAAIATMGWKTCAGFQTRNLAHRAHEYLQKLSLAFCDGLLIHPLIGWKKPGDMLPHTVIEGYELLREHFYPKGRSLLAGFATAMRYAGPKEAVFHALVRKNFGCTHFIIGRDHAGVGSFYETYAAHELIRSLPQEDLGITPLLFHGPRYCRRCEEIVPETLCPHGEEDVLQISGTEVRAMIARKERPPREVLRPMIAEFLIERESRGEAFCGED